MADDPTTGSGREIPPFQHSPAMCERMVKALNRVLVDAGREGGKKEHAPQSGLPTEYLITEQTKLYVYSTLRMVVEEVRNGGAHGG